MPHFVSRTGHQLYYRDLGRGDPLILLHGFGMQSAHWLPFALVLARSHRVIIPDLRGFGRSHHADYSDACVLSDFAHDLEELVTTLNLESFKLAGISMGALTALQYQKLYLGARVSHYLHIDQSPVCTNSHDWHWGLFGAEQASRFERAKLLLERLAPYAQDRSPYKALPDELKHDLWRELGEFFASAMSGQKQKVWAKRICHSRAAQKYLLPTSNWPVYLTCLRAYLERNYDMRDVLREVDIPTTVLVGIRSDMYPRAGQLRIPDYRSNCELVSMNKSGHAPLIDQPFVFGRELLRFANKR